MFDSLLEPACRRYDGLGLFGEAQFLPLEPFEASLIGLHEGWACGLDDPVQERVDLVLGVLELRRDRLLGPLRFC
ncbi:MAG: hypothetical protein AAF577_14770 [Pseudomonadota bacterium]